ncbi:MAG TPA: preprotein translocase subunit SecG [Candidatus Kapabacteria bacterium]
MFTVLVVLIIILCILLSLVVLAQSAKGNGLAGGLGAPGSVGTMFGVRRASDFLTKATIVIAAIFMLFSIAVNRLFLPTSTGQIVNPLREGPAPVQSMPGGGQPQAVPPGAQSAPVQAPAPAPAAPAN